MENNLNVQVNDFTVLQRMAICFAAGVAGAIGVVVFSHILFGLGLTLAADQLKTLDEASRIDLGFPQEIFTRELTRGLRSGGMADRIIA